MGKLIDKIFKSKISGLEVIPSDEAYMNFQEALNKKKRSGFLWWKVAAAIVFALFSVGILINNSNKLTSKDNLVSLVEGEPLSVNITEEEVCDDEIALPEPVEKDYEARPLSTSIKAISGKMNGKKSSGTIKEGFEKERRSLDKFTPETTVIRPAFDSMDMNFVSNQEVKEETISINNGNPEVAEMPKIRITYKSGKSRNKVKEPVLITYKLNRKGVGKKVKMLHNVMQDLTSGHLLAGIRDSKDQLFNKVKKKETKNR